MDQDAAAIARVITAALKGRRWADCTPLDFARAILASDWLAAHDAQVRAEALAPPTPLRKGLVNKRGGTARTYRATYGKDLDVGVENEGDLEQYGPNHE